jgi:hypothetical protein
MLDHPLDLLHPWFEDHEENIFVNSIENRHDRILQLLPVGAIELSKSFFDISEEEEVAWSEIGARCRMQQSFRPYRPIHSPDHRELWAGALSRWSTNHFNICWRQREVRSAIKLGRTVSHRNAVLHVIPLGTSMRLWIPLADQRIEIRHFSVSLLWLNLSDISSRDTADSDSYG